MNKAQVDQAIGGLCAQLAQEPMLYFSEADLQQLLVEMLKAKLFPEGKGLLCPTSAPRGKGFHKTSLVHREYGVGGKARIDVVIFDPDGLKKITSARFMDAGKKYVNPVYAFELGTEKSGQTAESTKEHLANDLKKLCRICSVNEKATCYILHFFRDPTTADNNTGLRKRTENKISKIRTVIADCCHSLIPKNLKILGVILRTKSRVRGRCSIYNGTTRQWTPKNISKKNAVIEAVAEQLR